MIGCDGEVVEHALHLARELRAAAELELADHEAFGIVRRRALVEKPLGELVSVDLGEQVLVGEVREELHRLLQVRLDVLVREFLAARLEDAVAKRRHELGVGELADVAVDELDEGFLQSFLEERVARELFGDDAEILVVQREQLLDEAGVLVGVLLARVEARLAPRDDVVAHRLDVGLDELRHRREPVGHAREQTVHARQIGRAVVLQQRAAPRAVLLEERRLAELEDLELADAEQLRFRRRVQIIRDPRFLGV
mmetsp:Transcript_3628/g.14167  ORF Transcript_3628/g.14167 Transcript_3628/m.14167 type:complete len:254 (+) Transcript_3628:1366-2127(+)